MNKPASRSRTWETGVKKHSWMGERRRSTIPFFHAAATTLSPDSEEIKKKKCLLYLAIVSLLGKDSAAIGKRVTDRGLVVDRFNHSLELFPHLIVNVDMLVVAKLGRQSRHVWRDLKVPNIVGSTLSLWVVLF